jgi:hypothetical protein
MEIALAAFGLMLAPGAYADGLPAFGSVSFASLRSVKNDIAVPRAKADDVLTAYHMLAQAGKNSLFGYADTAADAAEAAS